MLITNEGAEYQVYHRRYRERGRSGQGDDGLSDGVANEAGGGRGSGDLGE